MSPVFRSFAKLNLHLEVVARRPDGYHELRTLFQSVELHDLVGVELVEDDAGNRGLESAAGTSAPRVRLELRGGDAPPGEDNLAVRAAQGFLERWGDGRAARLTLEKRIPAGGGLGGGSSNAATVLLALQGLLGAPAPAYELWRLARELGADVPFFLVGGTALGVGRGDEIVSLPDLPARAPLLVIPPVAVSTAQVFAALGDLTPRPLASTIWALLRGDPAADPWSEGRNDLQGVVLQHFPAAREVYDALLEAGGEPARLSGSGGTFFGLLPAAGIGALRRRLPGDCAVIPTRSVSRSEFAASRMIPESPGA